jgi:hypothetical protein
MSLFLTPRSWLRFRLRTVLLLGALLAIPCAWIGSELKLVRNRSVLINRVEAGGGEVWAWDPDTPVTIPEEIWAPHHRHLIVIKPGTQFVQISRVRRWLGDQNVRRIDIPGVFSDDDEKRILELFPGVEVVKIPRGFTDASKSIPVN